MTLVTNICGQCAPIHGAKPPGPDPRIAVAGSWVCMLDALSDIAVRFSWFLVRQVAPASQVSKTPVLALPFVGNPFDAFVRAARAMELAIVLAFRLENEIDALRAGKPLGPDACISRTLRAEVTGMTKPSKLVGGKTAPGQKDREMARQAIVEAAEAPERLEGPMGMFLRGRFNGRMRKGPAFYRLLNGPLKDAVAAICADLGLEPDWSLWTEHGFPPPGGTKEDWIAFFVPKGDAAPAACPDQTEPVAPPRERVRDPGHLLDPPTWRLHEFLAANGIQPRPPPPMARRTFGAYPPLPLTP